MSYFATYVIQTIFLFMCRNTASRINKKDKQVKSGGARKAEVGKSSSMGGEKIGKIREENEGDITSDGNTTSLSSQTRKSKNESV